VKLSVPKIEKGEKSRGKGGSSQGGGGGGGGGCGGTVAQDQKGSADRLEKERNCELNGRKGKRGKESRTKGKPLNKKTFSSWFARKGGNLRSITHKPHRSGTGDLIREGEKKKKEERGKEESLRGGRKTG